jgi:hypothetical protein
VRIRFTDKKMQRVFNDYVQLEARFGAELATKIATRMAVLAAARDLGRIPRRPPIRLRPLDGSPGRFSVDLVPPRRLTFGALSGHAGNGDGNDVDKSRIEEIEVFGVE